MTNVCDFGAAGDGIQDDSEAIQGVLDNHDGLVLIPEGKYKIGSTLRVSSNTSIKAARQAYLFFADGAGKTNQDFLLTNKDPEAGNENILVQGGIWDGNNPGNPRGTDTPESYTGALMNFINVSSLTIKKLTVRDAESYFIRLGEVKRFAIEKIRFESPHMRPNQDGVHLGGYCETGVISDLVGVDEATNDDLVALNADDALTRAQNLDLKCGPIRNITVRNIKAESCHSFVRLLSVHSAIRQVTVKNVEGGCRCMAVNLDACRECRVKLFDGDDPQYADGVGDIQYIRLENFKVYKAAADDTTPLINLRSNVREFVIEKFIRDEVNESCSAAQTISFRNCGKTRMKLDGVEQGLAGTLEWTGEGALEKDDHSCTLVLEPGAEMKLLNGGFDRLSVETLCG